MSLFTAQSDMLLFFRSLLEVGGLRDLNLELLGLT